MNKKNNNKVDSLKYNNRVVFLFSLLIAICIWVLVAVFVSPNTFIIIKDVPISFNINDLSLKASGLEIISKDVESVDVTVEGNRAVVGSLTKDDISVSVSTIGVKGPGSYDFKLIVNKKDALTDFKVVKSNIESVNVTVDRLETRTIKIEPQINHLEVEEGYILDEVIVSPSEKNIKGPDTLINDISKVIVIIDEVEKLSDTKTYKKTIKYIDKTGNEIPSDKIYVENPEVEVTVPILKKATLPVSVEFLNAPSSLSVSKLKHSFSHQQIEVAGPKDKIDTTKNINLGYINFETFPKDGKFEFAVVLPEGFINTQNVETITVSFDQNVLARKYIKVNNISAINTPTNFDVEVVTRQINSVVIMGDKTQVNNSYFNDFVGEVDLSNIELVSGEMTVPVRIKSISKDGIFAVGSYTVVIMVKPKS